MSTHKAVEQVCAQAQTMAAELHAERKRRMALEAENEELNHRLRTTEIALHSNAPMDALEVIKKAPAAKRRLHS